MKNIFVTLLLFISINIYSSPLTHTITYNVTTNITCSAGDTLKLYGTFAGDYVASTYSGTLTVSNIFPTMVSSSPFYIGFFVIAGNETSFIFSEISHGPQTGTINVSSATGISDHYTYAEPKIFPNPCKDNITISVGKATVIDILSSDGSLIFSVPVQNSETSVDLSRYPSGLYFLRNKYKTYKIIKE